MNTYSIYGKVYDHYQTSETKIGARVFDALDREALGDIITDGTTFWIERSWDFPGEAVYNHVIKTVKKMGYKYLYESEK